MREVPVKRCLTFPAVLVLPKKTPVLQHAEASYVQCNSPLVRSLEGWCARTPASLLREFTEKTFWIYWGVWTSFFVAHLTCQRWGSGLQHARRQRGASQFSPQLLVSTRTAASVTCTCPRASPWRDDASDGFDSVFAVLGQWGNWSRTSCQWRIDKSRLCGDWMSHSPCKFSRSDSMAVECHCSCELHVGDDRKSRLEAWWDELSLYDCS